MQINPDVTVDISDTIRDFSRVARMADEQGSVVITKNGAPRYLLIQYSQAEDTRETSDEDVLSVSDRLIEKNRDAYEVLAK